MSFLWKKHNTMVSNVVGGIKTTNCEDSELLVTSPGENIDTPVSLKMKHKKKRYRSAFTTSQITLLEKEFKKDPYVTNARREQVAKNLELPERAVKIWFQNRRMKEKRDAYKIVIDTDEHPGNIHPVKITIMNDPTRKLTGTCNAQIKPIALAEKRLASNSGKTLENSNPSKIIEKIGTELHPSASKVNQQKTQRNIEVGFIPQESTSKMIAKPAKKDRQTNSSVNENQGDKETIQVGHILPFRQESVNEPKKEVVDGPTNQSIPIPNIKMASTPNIPTTQHLANVPIDLSKYCSPVHSIQTLPWNRYNLVPYLAPSTQTFPVFAEPQMYKTSMPVGIPNSSLKECCCDCHINSSNSYQQHPPQPFFYHPYLQQYVTSLPAPINNSQFK